MSQQALTVAFLKMKFVALFLAYDAGESAAAGRAMSLIDVLAMITGELFVDFTLAAEARREAVEEGARSSRMDRAQDGFGAAFKALARDFEAEAAAAPAEPFDPASYALGELAERARWTWTTTEQIEAAVRRAMTLGRVAAVGWIAGAVNDRLAEDGYTGPTIPDAVIVEVLRKMKSAAEVSLWKWVITCGT